MSAFEPQPSNPIVLFGESFRVAPHPTLPYMAYAQEARKALVFQLELGNNPNFAALKDRIFRLNFQAYSGFWQ